MPKNIVLLSDGTGNSAAKEFKTNVWRLYQAVDINPPQTANEPRQIVFYDDGVGTENFKPLAYLGLGFGLGLAHNIKDLYTFLCRNYEDGDGIFLFGFSRGAFTVRVLSGLILRCGLVTADSESDLKDRVEHAYDEYKLDAARRATGTGRANVLGRLLGGAEPAYARDCIRFNFEQKFPEITFIGVWDTVDAYGMPIDELKTGIDKYIWPMTLADRKLSKHVERACQALSLDDERPTFRPVLWDETGATSGQLTQVWFAGVHANVGGGYPDDGLACVALQWIMEEAWAKDLRFYRPRQKDVSYAANPHGQQYDSRSGIAGYYRYGPRDVDKLCDDTEHGVHVAVPKVHYAVLDRIREWQRAYAPVSFPKDYSVMVMADWPGVLEEAERKESDADVEGRSKDMESAWDAVARRRIAYFATVGSTLLLILLPPWSWMKATLGWSFHPLGSIADTLWAGFASIPLLRSALSSLSSWTSSVLALAKDFLWSWAGLWVDWYIGHPLFFLLTASLLAWLFVSKSARLQDDVFARADYAWRRRRGNPASPPPGSPPSSPPSGATKRNWADSMMRTVRKNNAIQAVYRFISREVVPFLFAIPAAAIGLLILPFFIPKFYRQALRRRRYRPRGGPDDTTPAPRISRSPLLHQPGGLVTELPAPVWPDIEPGAGTTAVTT